MTGALQSRCQVKLRGVSGGNPRGEQSKQDKQNHHRRAERSQSIAEKSAHESDSI
jgi:hypothetical protein